MPVRRQPLTAIAFLFIALALPLAGARADSHSEAERAIHYRHSLYHVIEWNVTAMGDVIKGKVPFEPKAFAMHADRVRFLVPMVLEGFPPGSYVEGHTAAKPAVWSDRATFEKLLEKLGAKSVALADAAAGRDLGTITPAFNALKDTCDECHKQFKNKSDH